MGAVWTWRTTARFPNIMNQDRAMATIAESIPDQQAQNSSPACPKTSTRLLGRKLALFCDISFHIHENTGAVRGTISSHSSRTPPLTFLVTRPRETATHEQPEHIFINIFGVVSICCRGRLLRVRSGGQNVQPSSHQRIFQIWLIIELKPIRKTISNELLVVLTQTSSVRLLQSPFPIEISP